MLNKLEFRSRELSKENIEQYNEQWKNVIRKSKLDLTSIMRSAKVKEIEKNEQEHTELTEKIPVSIRPAYRDLIETIRIRQEKISQKKIHFLERKGKRTNEK